MSRGNLWRALTLIGALCASLAVIEVALRLAAPAPIAPSAPAPRGDGLPELTHIFQLAAPSQRGIYNGALYETNELGLRSRVTPIAKPAGRFRIVALGDSIVMGEGVEVEQRYTDLVERRLAEAPPGRAVDVEIINAGLAGLSLAQAVVRLEQVGLRYEPDMLVYGFTVNDLEGDHYERLVEVTKSARQAAPPSASRLVSLVRARWRSALELFAPPADSYVHELDHNYFENPAAWRDFEAALDRLAEIADERGVCTVMLVHTHLFHLHRWHPLRRHYDAAAQAARARGFEVVQSLPAFEGADPEALWLSPTDAHPNPEGHRRLADALMEGLARLPARCWEPRGAGAASVRDGADRVGDGRPGESHAPGRSQE